MIGYRVNASLSVVGFEPSELDCEVDTETRTVAVKFGVNFSEAVLDDLADRPADLQAIGAAIVLAAREAMRVAAAGIPPSAQEAIDEIRRRHNF